TRKRTHTSSLCTGGGTQQTISGDERPWKKK
ncbi:hypothetical protein PC112_g11200, partial [Phytophthora cactorum]